MFGTLGPTELLIILAIIVVLFGASRLAGLGGALGCQRRRDLAQRILDRHTLVHRRVDEEAQVGRDTPSDGVAQ